jgi:Domain of Unknown Function (DUF928)
MKVFNLIIMNKKKSILIVLMKVFLCLELLNIPIAKADYKPPSNQRKAPQNTHTGSGTTRGCEGGIISPTILASHNFMGQTISTHPTLVWFIPDSQPREMKFMLYEYTQEGQYKQIYQKITKTSPGVMTFTLPKNEPPLKINQTYVGQVVIFCDPNSPSTALFDQVHFEVVNIPDNLQDLLTNASSSLEKANVYAAFGLWYDALSEAVKLVPSGQLGEVGKLLLKDLINQEKANINPVADQSRINGLQEISNLEL